MLQVVLGTVGLTVECFSAGALPSLLRLLVVSGLALGASLSLGSRAGADAAQSPLPQADSGSASASPETPLSEGRAHRPQGVAWSFSLQNNHLSVSFRLMYLVLRCFC